MTFVRAFIGKTSNQVRHVLEQDVPFTTGGLVRAGDEELEVVDLGFAEDHDWRDLEGRPAAPAQHIFLRMRDKPAAEALAVREGLPMFHDCPCSLEGIKARLRARGVPGIPVKVRAWLAAVLSPDQVAALGVGRGLPIAALKAAEALRNRKDPHGGSRMLRLEREAQRNSDGRSRAALRRRQQAAARNKVEEA